MSLDRRPVFSYVDPNLGTVTVTATFSQRPWLPVDATVGGNRWAGQTPASYIVHRYADLELSLRITEAEWPDWLLFLQFAQTAETFEFTPDDDEGGAFTCYLVHPMAGEDIRPLRHEEYMSVYNLNITIRRTSGEAWDLEYFGTVGLS